MTRLFDEKARAAHAAGDMPFAEYSGSDAKARELEVKQIPVKEARPYIATHHYSRTMPDASKECFAGFFGEEIAGIMVFGMGASKSIFTRIDPDIKNGEYRELTRGWVADAAPKNTNTRLIAKAIRALPPEVKFVVSFADSEQGHEGTVYRAANFTYDGVSESSGGQRLFDEGGHEVHPRLLGIYKIRHPETYGGMSGGEIADALGWRIERGGRSLKHRFIYHRNGRTEPKVKP